MEITEEKVKSVQRIVTDWNPLGAQAAQIPDLEEYFGEAQDILCELDLPPHTRPERIVQEVLNEAFGLDLTGSDCVDAAAKILECAKQD